MVNILNHYGPFVTTQKATLVHWYSLVPVFYLDFASLSSVPFLCQNPIQNTPLHLGPTCPLSPLVSNKFSDFPCFQWPWQFWAVLAKYFVEYPSVQIFLLFSHWLDWGDGLEEEDNEGKYHHITSHHITWHNITWHHITGTCYQYDLSLDTLILITWKEECSLGFCSVKLPFPAFMYSFLVVIKFSWHSRLPPHF